MTTTTAKTYDRQTAQFLATVGQNVPEIPSALMQEWIEHPKDLQQALWKALYPLATVPTFQTWKTVTIGMQKSVKDPSKALTSNGFRISDWAADILKWTRLVEAETEIELVRVTVRELGFNKATRRYAIYDRAEELDLGFVPAEVGPQLRLAYSDQPMDEWLLMGMEPIARSDGYLRVFGVGRYGTASGSSATTAALTTCGILAVSGSSPAASKISTRSLGQSALTLTLRPLDFARVWISSSAGFFYLAWYNPYNRWVFARRNSLHFPVLAGFSFALSDLEYLLVPVCHSTLGSSLFIPRSCKEIVPAI